MYLIQIKNNYKDQINDTQVIKALELLKDTTSKVIQYYNDNKNFMHNDIMYSDTLASIKELTRGINIDLLKTYN